MNALPSLNSLVGPAISLGRCGTPPAVCAPTVSDVVLGMPHLSSTGLSETWLLKELGHRHWCLLAQAAGMAVPDFRDEAGEPVYAAFCALTITGGRLDDARENDTLVIASVAARISRTQVVSRHRLTINGRAIGVVEMVSAFVKRIAHSNHAVVRIPVDRLPPIDADFGSTVAASAVAFRGNRVRDYMGFDLACTSASASFDFEPCPSQDFNGAGFLYFTSFVAFVDRAEWLFDRSLGLRATTRRRDVFFHGNIDPGEAIRVVLLQRRREASVVTHHHRVERSVDGAILAEVFTAREIGR